MAKRVKGGGDERSVVRGTMSDVRGALSYFRGAISDVRCVMSDVRGDMCDVRGEMYDQRNNAIGTCNSSGSSTYLCSSASRFTRSDIYEWVRKDRLRME